MPALDPARLAEIRAVVTELVAHRNMPDLDLDRAPALLHRCERALADVLADRDDLAADLTEVTEELATWTGALR